MHLRSALPGDAPAMLAIYAPYVLETAISFELEPPSLAEFEGRLRDVQAHAPWLVCADGPSILGYAYASRFRTRAAYRWTVETTVYIHADHHGRGLGRALYAALLACLAIQGFRTAVAGTTLPNDASVRLHRAAGYSTVGILKAVGYKFGAWHDVMWLEKTLTEPSGEPAEPLTPAAAQSLPAWQAALADASAI